MEVILLTLAFVIVAYTDVLGSTLAYDLATGRYKRLYESVRVVNNSQPQHEAQSKEAYWA